MLAACCWQQSLLKHEADLALTSTLSKRGGLFCIHVLPNSFGLHAGVSSRGAAASGSTEAAGDAEEDAFLVVKRRDVFDAAPTPSAAAPVEAGVGRYWCAANDPVIALHYLVS